MNSHFPAPDFTDKAAGYRELDAQLAALLAGERDAIANLANTSALLYAALPQLNWAGFYLLHPSPQDGADGGSGELVLGPFQGRPACVRIPMGKGVCGAAASQRQTMLVPDVEAFPGHIACDSASRSELVVPLLVGDKLIGVLDLDSPELNRFDADDQAGCEALAQVIVRHLT